MKKTPKNIPSPYKSKGTPIFRDTTDSNLFNDGGKAGKSKYYTYKDHRDQYMKKGNQWYISNEFTDFNFQPIKDPKGTRAKELNKNAKEFPIDEGKTFEAKVNKALGNPMDQAYRAAEYFAPPGEDPIDNFRHPIAGRYATEAISNYVNSGYPIIDKAVGFIGANAIGVGHELNTLLKDKRPWSTKLPEAGEDIYNNFIGTTIGVSSMTPRQKTNYLLNLSDNNQLPDGYGPRDDKKNMYWKDQQGRGSYNSKFENGGELLAQPYPNSFFASDLKSYYADGGPLHDRDNESGRLLNSTYASALGRMFRDGGYFDHGYSLPEDSFRQGGRGLKDSIYASTSGQYPANYKQGGSILSMSNTPQLEGEGKDLNYPSKGYAYANGGMIKRADGSYSKRGLWDNKGSGKKRTKEILAQEKKINANTYDVGGPIYTYAGRPDAQYKKVNDKWFINAPGTNGFIPVNDPSGKRTTLLNQQAVVQPRAKNYNPLLQPTAPSETLQNVAKNTMQAENLNQYSRNIDRALAVQNAQDPGFMYKSMDANQLSQFATPELQSKAESLVKQGMYNSLEDATRDLLVAREEQKFNAPVQQASAWNNYNDAPVQSADWVWTLPMGVNAIPATLEGIAGLAGKEILGSGIKAGTAADIYFGGQGVGNVVNAVEASRYGDTERRDQELLNAGLNLGVPLGLGALSGTKAALQQAERLGVRNVVTGKAPVKDLFKRDDLVNINTPEDLANYQAAMLEGKLSPTRNRYYSSLDNPDLLKYVKGEKNVFVHTVPQTKAASVGKSLANVKPQGTELLARQRSVPTVSDVDELINSGKLSGYSDETLQGLKEVATNPQGYWNLDSFKTNPELQNLIKDPNLVNPAEHLLPRPNPEDFVLMPVGAIGASKPALIEGKEILNEALKGIQNAGKPATAAKSGTLLEQEDTTTTFKQGGAMNPIHINPENRGKFNETKRRTGKTTEELTHSKNPLTRKRAIFAQNAAKWNNMGGNLYDIGGDIWKGLSKNARVSVSPYNQDYNSVLAARDVAYQLNPVTHGYGIGYDKRIQLSKDPRFKTRVGANLSIPYGANQAPTVQGTFQGDYYSGVNPGSMGAPIVSTKIAAGYDPNKKLNAYIEAMPRWEIGNISAAKKAQDKYYKGDWSAYAGPMGGIGMQVDRGALLASAFYGAGAGFQAQPFRAPLRIGADARIGFQSGEGREESVNAENRGDKRSLLHNARVYASYPLDKLGRDIKRSASKIDWPEVGPVDITAPGFYFNKPEFGSWKQGESPKGFLPGYEPETGKKLSEKDVKKRYNYTAPAENKTFSIMENPTFKFGGRFNNPGFKALPSNVQSKIKANSFADGGPMAQLTEFNAGGTHEENPIGGIPQGVAPNGQVNLVEQGETKLNSEDYVFSDSLKVDKETAKNFGLPNNTVGKTFAEASKTLNMPKSRRENDTIEESAIKRNLDNLMGAQEFYKQEQVDNKLAELQSLAPDLYEQMMQGMQSYQPMVMGEGMPGEMTEQEVMMDETGQPIDPNQIPPEMLAQMPEAQAGMPVMAYGGHMYKCGGKMYNFGGQMYNMGGNMYNYGGRMFEGGGGLTAEEKARMAQGSYLANTPTPGITSSLSTLSQGSEPTAAEKAKHEAQVQNITGQIGKYGNIAAQGVNTGMVLADKNATDEQKGEAVYDTAVGAVTAINPVVGGLIQVGDMIGEPLKENVFEKYNDEGELENENLAKTGYILNVGLNPAKNLTNLYSDKDISDTRKILGTFTGGYSEAFYADQYAKDLERKKRKELGLPEYEVNPVTSQIGAVMNPNSMAQGGYLVPSHDYPKSYPTYKDNAGPQGQPLTNLYADGGQMYNESLASYSPDAFNMLNMGQRLGQQMYEPLDQVYAMGGNMYVNGGTMGDPPPGQQYYANPEDEYMAEFLAAEENKYSPANFPGTTVAPVSGTYNPMNADYRDNSDFDTFLANEEAKYNVTPTAPAATTNQTPVTAAEVLTSNNQDELVKLQNDILNAETEEELKAAQDAYRSALQRLDETLGKNDVDMTIQRKLGRDIAMAAPAAYNVATGLFERANRLNPANYMVKADLTGPKMDIEPTRRGIQQSYAQAMNAARNAGLSGGNYMTNVQQLNIGRNAAVSQAEAAKANADAAAEYQAMVGNKQIEANNVQTKQQIEQLNRQAAAAKRNTFTTGLTQWADMAKNLYDLDAQKTLAKAISPTFGDKFGLKSYKVVEEIMAQRATKEAEKNKKKEEEKKS
jgi:hypothetical protein